MTLGFIFPDCLFKLQARKQLEYLRKNAAYSTQGGFLLRLRLFWSKLNLRQRGSAFIHFYKLIWTSLLHCNVSRAKRGVVLLVSIACRPAADESAGCRGWSALKRDTPILKTL